MRSRGRLSPARVVEAALEIVDGAGADALTLARVAERLGVAPPSLYKHVDGLPSLRRLMRLRVLRELDDALREATLGRSGEDALRAFGAAYRGYLRRYPHRHELLEAAPDRDDPELTTLAERVVGVVYAVLRGYGLTGSAAVHATRCLRAAIHGFARLEAYGGFGLPEDVDETFDRLLRMLAGGVSTMAAPADHVEPREKRPLPPR